MEKIRLPRDGIIHIGWLVNGHDEPPVSDVRIVFQDRIVRDVLTDVRDVSEVEDSGRDLPVLDYSTCTLMPAWIDCHVHLTMSGTVDPEIRRSQIDLDYPEASASIATHLQDHMRYGIAAVRDGGDPQGHNLRFTHGSTCPPKQDIVIRAAGKAWYQKGRYGKLIGRYPAPGHSLANSVSAEFEQMDDLHPDHVKIVNSGLNSLTTFGKETPPQFSFEELTGAVRMARQAGIPVMVHANGVEPVRIAVQAGCTSIEHGFFMGPDNLRLMADRMIFWTPTTVTMKMYGEYLKAGSIESETAHRNLDHQLTQMALGDRFGVPMVLGTDSGSLGVFHGRSAVEEFNLMREAGISVSRVVRCATFHGSRLLQIPDLGTVEPGKRAAFTVFDGHPEKFPIHADAIRGLS